MNGILIKCRLPVVNRIYLMFPQLNLILKSLVPEAFPGNEFSIQTYIPGVFPGKDSGIQNKFLWCFLSGDDLAIQTHLLDLFSSSWFPL